ncbi:MAG: putative Ig domain-containing protein [Bacteroidales bacterium]|nr:putative Ig domain-containing protein [Bacteroidales bacterium]
MKKLLFVLFALPLWVVSFAQGVSVESAKFSVGDKPEWAQPAFNDSSWATLRLDSDWSRQGYRNSNAYGWYRLHVVIPSSLKGGITRDILFDMGPIDDTDETWLNGHLVGKTGRNPGEKGGFDGKWNVPRRYVVSPEWVRWDQENIIAVRVYNGADPGGFYTRPVHVGKPELKDYVSLRLNRREGEYVATVSSRIKTSGTVQAQVIDPLTDKTLSSRTWKIRLNGKKDHTFTQPTPEGARVIFTYSDEKFDDFLEVNVSTPYILTPPAPATPRYNGPLVFGVRPGSPVIFRLAFSGEKPMTYKVEGLPEGVVLDPEKGVLSGSVKKEGDYPLVITATNAKGSTRASFTLKVGAQIALTPPMGWNSWNCWGTSVSQEKVMASAVALINRGLVDYGYSYMNIDDAWEAAERAADGTILTNEKFPDMKALSDWLHGNGLRLGIYSSPGSHTCGGYLGSLGHEEQDAKTWNDWGIDYLKYDWCGYNKVFAASSDHSTAAYLRPYVKMQQYLREQPRDIFYSLCQYGMAKVWEWGAYIDANSWRTTGDITDTWESVRSIGFEQQAGLHPYAGPGHWNDPDMLVVGKVGWSNNLRDSRLTPDEQYTHISLWSLLASNMLIGCPLDQIDDFTFNLLCNNEVNAVNQDILGHQAHQDVVEDNVQIWSRDLYDGGKAVGIFNLNDAAMPTLLKGALGKIGIKAETVRDLWRQKDIPTDAVYRIPAHGVLYVKVK